MTNEEIVNLIKCGNDTAQNMLQLWKQMELLIIFIARKYGNLAELEDLKQEGYLALYDAIDGYNQEAGVSFANYAVLHIKSRMRRYIFGSSAIYIPQWIHEKLYQYEKVVEDLKCKYGHEPSKAEIMEQISLTEKKFDKIIDAKGKIKVRSIDAPIGEDEESTVGDLISSGVDIAEVVIELETSKELSEILWGTVEELEPMAAAIIKERYKNGLTLSEAAKKINADFTEARAAEKRGMRKLKSPICRNRLKKFLTDQSEVVAYRGSYNHFKTTWTSSTEKAALMDLI